MSRERSEGRCYRVGSVHERGLFVGYAEPDLLFLDLGCGLQAQMTARAIKEAG